MQIGNWPQVTLVPRGATTGPQADLLLSSSTSPPATCLSEPAFLCQLGLPCCYFPIAHEDPSARGVEASALLSHTGEAGFERGVPLLLPSQHQGWRAGGAEGRFSSDDVWFRRAVPGRRGARLTFLC